MDILLVTIMPVILGGIFNMLFCKTNFYRAHNAPIDGGRTLGDGKRIFGENKTFAGFAGMIDFCMIFQVLTGLVCIVSSLSSELYTHHANTLIFNLYTGFLLGFAYMICELPNSFVKRRLDISPGKTRSPLSFVIDQIDSVIGVAFVICLFSGLWQHYFMYIVLGGAIHIAVNFVLYRLKIRRDP